MNVLTKELKHSVIGMLVLFSLVIIFVPIIFNRPDELRPIEIQVPAAPKPAAIKAQTVTKTVIPKLVPELVENDLSPNLVAAEKEKPSANNAQLNQNLDLTESVKSEHKAESANQNLSQKSSKSSVSSPATNPKPADLSKKEVKKPRLDANGLPITWSVQLSSFSKRESALNLQETLRKDGYNAYIREANGMHRVFVGPVIEHSSAQKILDESLRKYKLKGIIVRFKP